ncbi:MAG: hypothetical protein D6712_12640 [Chloroflexi bacterium]|nr:MAG: hypothetical protein D6712_12640 [Chloroflexota bacterium]
MVAKHSKARYSSWLLWGTVFFLLLEAATLTWSGAWWALLIITLGVTFWLVCLETGRCISAWAYNDIGTALIVLGALALLVVDGRLAVARVVLLWPLLLAGLAVMLKKR